ncbi:hypothetical protein CEUSTIGMA_g979.t1 [Chlamydomonas eustigma]|uniref:Glycosyltransferase family 49 protein n=1 Tax=Chlamydomonas eustigma TaxID=1157962 RepID=A0A250WRQ2_9CHLO|nr:hypothetical protein CEUSTIGMA_g979.t1 [Chlamydomonas eustigma]|eukprot:GAX73527.1 hypothetical protein CEUSTIGMA_g979.t1 [Chlamydomonas eustigma]
MTWKGSLAAAVYLPLVLKLDGKVQAVETLDVEAEKIVAEAEFKLEEFSKWASTEDASCQPRLLLLIEVFKKQRAASALYPVNMLRNYARLLAETPLIANIDVDMLPSTSLSDSLANDEGSREIVEGCTKKGYVYVIPAFETRCGGPSYADSAAIMKKAELLDPIRNDCLTQFRQKVAPACHNVTDFPRWFQTTHAYSVHYRPEFEPWFISDRLKTQWYDVRYRGYGKNKIIQVAHTAASGFAFYVHPSGFLVHRQHTESSSRKAFLQVKFKSRQNPQLLNGSLYSHIEELWREDQANILAGSYKPKLDQALSACIVGTALSWWNA